MEINKNFTEYYNKHSVKYSKYLFYTIIGSFWGWNKFLIKDFKSCYDRLVFGSVSVIVSIIFFYFYIVLANFLSIYRGFSFEEVEHFKQLVFAFFIPIFFIVICNYTFELIKDLIEGKNDVIRYNHKIKKLILKEKTKELEKLEVKDSNTYKLLFNYGSLYGLYSAYSGNKIKHILLSIFPSLSSILLIVNLLIDLLCAIFYICNFLIPSTNMFMLYSVTANISVSILSFLLFKIVPIWLCFNLLLIFKDYKQIKNIKIEKRF